MLGGLPSRLHVKSNHCGQFQEQARQVYKHCHGGRCTMNVAAGAAPHGTTWSSTAAAFNAVKPSAVPLQRQGAHLVSKRSNGARLGTNRMDLNSSCPSTAKCFTASGSCARRAPGSLLVPPLRGQAVECCRLHHEIARVCASRTHVEHSVCSAGLLAWARVIQCHQPGQRAGCIR